jgi:hypothetical protein
MILKGKLTNLALAGTLALGLGGCREPIFDGEIDGQRIVYYPAQSFFGESFFGEKLKIYEGDKISRKIKNFSDDNNVGNEGRDRYVIYSEGKPKIIYNLGSVELVGGRTFSSEGSRIEKEIVSAGRERFSEATNLLMYFKRKISQKLQKEVRGRE